MGLNRLSFEYVDINNSLDKTVDLFLLGTRLQAMTLISAFGPLNYAGCFAATMSSALASYISCPKLLQVIADDKLYPYWLVGVLGKGYGISQEPIRAYLFTFIVALIFILIGIT